MRVLMVMDTQFDAATGAPPTLDDVLDLSTPNIFAYNDLQIQGTRRFRVLWDRMTTLYCTRINAVDPEIDSYPNRKIFRYNKKMRKPLYYNGDDATAASMGKNAIWLFVFMDVPANDYPVVISGVSRIRFTDV